MRLETLKAIREIFLKIEFQTYLLDYVTSRVYSTKPEKLSCEGYGLRKTAQKVAFLPSILPPSPPLFKKARYLDPPLKIWLRN